ncbi:MAG: cytochrome d ubiquinol oxidase subunit II [Pseudomonadota bacterium]
MLDQTTYPVMTEMAGWLPLAFMILMGLAILAYVILDGYDLGVGMLSAFAKPDERDLMIASIGPFWDANETWLVLGVGILLVAFPAAHGVILGALYLPVAAMLLGLTMRGVAFDFRSKADERFKRAWDFAFAAGSALAAVAQGYMLGKLVLGFQNTALAAVFALGIGLGLAAGYALLGAGWLIMKTDGALQLRAVVWARRALVLTAVGLAAVSLATPLVSERIFDKWFALENLLGMWPIPVMTVTLVFIIRRALLRLPKRLEDQNEYGIWVPFACAAGLFVLAFHGLAYSLFPWLVVDRLTIWDAASAPESLLVMFVGAVIVIPVIIAYSAIAYRVFHGKARPLEYY